MRSLLSGPVVTKADEAYLPEERREA